MSIKNQYKKQKSTFLPVFTGLLLFILPIYGFAQNNEGLQAATWALDDVQKNINLSEERISELDNEVAHLKKDQETISKALVDAAQAERLAANNSAESQKKMKALLAQEEDVRKKLQKRQKEFSAVLATLQRMGLKPPPALLVRSDDALSSIRSAVLLGAVVPEMRARTLQLATTLKELASVNDAIATENKQLLQEQIKQAEEQSRLKLLLAEKAKLQKASENQIEEQRRITIELAQKARTLEDLVTELNKQEQRLKTQSGHQQDYQLTSEVNFNLLRGKLQRPVSGKVIRNFGTGGAQGESIETAPASIVTAPADAIVAYAGNFRSYGRIVIFDVGDNYRILIAGMEHLDVSIGQFVLAGEPIGTMGSQLIASATALDIGKGTPMLYIEFRQGKEGKPIDPTPWWDSRILGRNSNDS